MRVRTEIQGMELGNFKLKSTICPIKWLSNLSINYNKASFKIENIDFHLFTNFIPFSNAFFPKLDYNDQYNYVLKNRQNYTEDVCWNRKSALKFLFGHLQH